MARGQFVTLELSSFERGNAGAAGLVANFYKADRETYAGIQKATRQAAAEMLLIMQRLCPVDTSFMKNHIVVTLTRNDLVFEAGWRATDFFDAGLPFYPFFVEFGTVKMAAQPTLRPAYREVGPIYREAVKAEVQAAIARLSAFR